MSKINVQAYTLAAKVGSILEGQNIQASGAALGIVLGQFILLLEREDRGIEEGIQAIAEDAKEAAKRIRNMRQ